VHSTIFSEVTPSQTYMFPPMVRRAESLYCSGMVSFAISIVAAIAVCFYLPSLLRPLDYNWYVRELKMSLPVTGDASYPEAL
jgi:hypothetical protein